MSYLLKKNLWYLFAFLLYLSFFYFTKFLAEKWVGKVGNTINLSDYLTFLIGMLISPIKAIYRLRNVFFFIIKNKFCTAESYLDILAGIGGILTCLFCNLLYRGNTGIDLYCIPLAVGFYSFSVICSAESETVQVFKFDTARLPMHTFILRSFLT